MPLDEDALKVLTMITVNNKPEHVTVTIVTCKTKTNIDLILDDLVKARSLNAGRGSPYYSIRVGLFKEWLIVNQ